MAFLSFDAIQSAPPSGSAAQPMLPGKAPTSYSRLSVMCANHGRPGTSHRSSDSANQFMENTKTPPLTYKHDNDTQLSVNAISNAFRAGFPGSTFVYENFRELSQKVADVLKKMNINTVTDTLTFSGNFTSDQHEIHIGKLTNEADVLKSLESMNSAVSGDLLWEHADYRQANKQLFKLWLHNLEKVVTNLVTFARHLPDFNSLPFEEREILIKASRVEIALLVKVKHVNYRAQAIINYQRDTDMIVLLPSDVLMKMLMGKPGEASAYESAFKKLVLEMSSLDLEIDNLSVLCALTLLAPDREGLSEMTQIRLSKVQDRLIAILRNNLSITHPQNELVMPRVLMLLPKLRELHEFNKHALIRAQQRMDSDLRPLLKAVLCDDVTTG